MNVYSDNRTAWGRTFGKDGETKLLNVKQMESSLASFRFWGFIKDPPIVAGGEEED